jgi:coenzyme F420-reducing hydrogenase alpha subunit
MKDETIDIHHITRVEGHGRLIVNIKEKRIEKVQMEIFEGARMFEAWLRNRRYDEIPHLACRICGICTAAHTVCALNAVENATGIRPSKQTRLLRNLMTIGGIIQSHTLHMYFLALPDFLGYNSAMEMAEDHPDEVKGALRMKKLGNDIVDIVAGRAVHPISAVVNGFTRIPTKGESERLLKMLKELRPTAKGAIEIFKDLNYPDFERKTEYIALQSKKEYALMDGDCIASTAGWKSKINEWDKYAKQGIRDGHGYLAGPLARVNLNFDLLCDDAKDGVNSSGIKFPSYNPFHNNFARAVELLHCFDEAISILESNKFKEEKREHKIKSGEGWAATEAPRGTLYHHYAINGSGISEDANVLTPTAQNLHNIEEDANELIPQIIDKPKEEIVLNLEMLIRSYDPCISCATHFIDVDFI